MALQLTGKEFEVIRNEFLEIDKDNNGLLTKDELKIFFSGGDDNRSDDEIDYMMKMMDLDKSGTIEFPEFLEMVAFFEYTKVPYEVQVTQMFKALDKNGDGFVSAEELQHLWTIFTNGNYNLPGEEEIADIVNSIDINGDGKIDYSEFMNALDFEAMELCGAC